MIDAATVHALKNGSEAVTFDNEGRPCMLWATRLQRHKGTASAQSNRMRFLDTHTSDAASASAVPSHC